MRTPEEIKKMLKRCSNADCSLCMSSYCCDIIAEALEYIQQLENQIGELTEKVAQLEAAQPKWISVEDRLPNVEVLAANFAPKTYGYKEYIIGYVSVEKCTEHGKYCASNDYEILYNVTHWMPLPVPPRSDDHD